MSDKLTLRARFPDGRAVTLTGLPLNTTYGELLTELCTRADLATPPERVLLAGPPPRPLELPQDTQLSSFLQTGDSLIVEPTRAVTARRPRRGRGRKTMVERANEALQKRVVGSAAPASSAKRKRIATIDSTGRGRGRGRGRGSAVSRAMGLDIGADDPRDKDWTVEDEESEDEVVPVAAKASGSGTASASSKRPKRRQRDQKNELNDIALSQLETMDMGAIQGALGARVVEALTHGEKDGDDGKVNGKFRDALQSALGDKYQEADGERRYEAMLAGRVKYTEVARGRAFRVEYRPLAEKAWRKDMDGGIIMTYSRELLTSSLQAVLENEEDRRNLKPLEMAIRSPKVFWNVAKIFPGDIEGGLRELVPDANWSFLDGRHRTLSRKGKRNLENKEEMGWTSD